MWEKVSLLEMTATLVHVNPEDGCHAQRKLAVSLSFSKQSVTEMENAC